MAVENVPTFDGLLGYGGRGPFSMAVENVPPSFHVPTTLNRNISNMYNLHSDFELETYLLVLTRNDTGENCNLLRFV